MLDQINTTLSNITWNIYVAPLWFIGLAMLFLVSIWATFGNIGTKNTPRLWRFLNKLLFVFSIAMILYVTLFNREPGDHTPDLMPFSFIERAQYNTEVYRSVIMNVFLFVPFGLFTPYACKRKNFRKTILWASLLSVGIEIIQNILSIGMLATDDVIANFAGALIGSLAFLLVKLADRIPKN